jgi:hypothetical protein
VIIEDHCGEFDVNATKIVQQSIADMIGITAVADEIAQSTAAGP